MKAMIAAVIASALALVFFYISDSANPREVAAPCDVEECQSAEPDLDLANVEEVYEEPILTEREELPIAIIAGEPVVMSEKTKAEILEEKVSLLFDAEEEAWEKAKAEPGFRERQVHELALRYGVEVSEEAYHELLACAHRGWDGDQEGRFKEIVAAYP